VMLKRYADLINAACEKDLSVAHARGTSTMRHCLEAKPFEPQAELILPTTDAMLGFIGSGLVKHPEMVGVNTEYLHELMWGGAPRAALARALVAGKLWHIDINDGYRLKHDVDIAVGLINPLDWLNVLVLLRAHGYNGPFNLDYKPARTTSNYGVFKVSFPTAVDRFITLWEIAGEAIADPIIGEATRALETGGGVAEVDNPDAVVRGEQGTMDAPRTDQPPASSDPAWTTSRQYLCGSEAVKAGTQVDPEGNCVVFELSPSISGAKCRVVACRGRYEFSRYTYVSPVERHILRGSPEGSARRCPPPRPGAVGRDAFTSGSMKATSQ
jgi:hypothetical protein